MLESGHSWARSPLRALAFLLLATLLAQDPGREYCRSKVIAQQGIVTTSHILASQAGAQILAKGGYESPRQPFGTQPLPAFARIPGARKAAESEERDAPVHSASTGAPTTAST